MYKSLCFLLMMASASCASLDPERMGDIDSSGLTQHEQMVELAVSARVDGELDDMGVFLNDFDLAAEELDASVRHAIEGSSFLAGTRPGSDWILSVVLRRSALVEGTESKMSREAQVVCDWSLTARGAAAPAWRERISTRDLKTFSDVFAGDKRTARAIESAVRKNIEGAFRSLDQSGALSGPAQ